MKKRTKPKRRKKKVTALPPPPAPPQEYWPKPGETVLIVRSSVNYAEGKIGVVEHPHEGGWAVRVKAKKVDAKNYGSLERDESESTVWAQTVKPYTPPKEDEKR